MPKNSYKRKKQYKAKVHKKIREGMVNTPGGGWRPMNTGNSAKRDRMATQT